MNNKKIAIIGLGYVGLPLAVEFGKNREVIGFDIDQERVSELNNGRDSTLELSTLDLSKACNVIYTTNIEDLRDCEIYIIAVPTPIDIYNNPDLTALKKSSETVGAVLNNGDIVIYESTVFPGATEEVCVPILEQYSTLTYNQDFFCGYSPERINPGDKEHRVANIKKVTSGSTEKIATFVDNLYKEIITAGTFKAASIKVAEASKIAENIQRDVNIAIINELAIIFNQLDIDTESVLEAARSKWNFLDFRPGLVGGHCIGVDPYYLKHKAQSVGYEPVIISAVRHLNDNMGNYVVGMLIKTMVNRNKTIVNAKALILGLTFKENCPDLRNTKVVDIVNALKGHSVIVDVHDPWASDKEAKDKLGVNLVGSPNKSYYDIIIIAVAHDDFKIMGADIIRSYGTGKEILYDLKNVLLQDESDLRL